MKKLIFCLMSMLTFSIWHLSVFALETVQVTGVIPVYGTAIDAKNMVNQVNSYDSGRYYIYKKHNDMLNISKDAGNVGAWINPNAYANLLVFNDTEIENKVQIGWVKEGNDWYYKNSFGNNVTNQWIDGLYYIKADGKMAVNEWVYDNHYLAYYYLDQNGVYVKNRWINSYYTKADGKRAISEWIYDKNYQSYYYLDVDGIYLINKFQDKYYLKSDGKMAVSEWIYDNITASYYYMDQAGAYVTNSWQGVYYLKSDGKMAVSEWIYDNHYRAYYYLDQNGVYATNTWQGHYYLSYNGKMLTNAWTPDGYYVDDSGKWVEGKKSARVPVDVGYLGQYSDRRFSWSWSSPAPDGLKVLESNGGLYKYYTSEKVLYLTFDNGYEAGHTNSILNTLKNNNVRAVFFVTGTYIRDNLALVKRMEEEGHIVANHTLKHYDAAKKDAWTITKDIQDWTDYYIKYMGKSPATNLYRPATGTFSERTVKGALSQGYKLVLWSYAYHDWDERNQPPVNESREKMIQKTKSGDILLLHSNSRTNRDLLDGYIKTMKNKGYTFKLVN